MLVLRRQFLGVEEEPNDLFIHVHFDTHRIGYLHNWKRFYDGDWFNNKPWMGEASTARKRFEVSRTDVGYFHLNFVPIFIRGEEVIEGSEKKVKLTYGISLLLILLGLLTFIAGTAMAILFLGEWGIVLALCFLVLNILTTALELNKSEAYMANYLDSLRHAKRE